VRKWGNIILTLVTCFTSRRFHFQGEVFIGKQKDVWSIFYLIWSKSDVHAKSSDILCGRKHLKGRSKFDECFYFGCLESDIHLFSCAEYNDILILRCNFWHIHDFKCFNWWIISRWRGISVSKGLFTYYVGNFSGILLPPPLVRACQLLGPLADVRSSLPPNGTKSVH